MKPSAIGGKGVIRSVDDPGRLTDWQLRHGTGTRTTLWAAENTEAIHTPLEEERIPAQADNFRLSPLLQVFLALTGNAVTGVEGDRQSARLRWPPRALPSNGHGAPPQFSLDNGHGLQGSAELTHLPKPGFVTASCEFRWSVRTGTLTCEKH